MAYKVSFLISQDVRTVVKASDWPIPDLGTVKTCIYLSKKNDRQITALWVSANQEVKAICFKVILL